MTYSIPITKREYGFSRWFHRRFLIFSTRIDYRQRNVIEETGREGGWGIELFTQSEVNAESTNRQSLDHFDEYVADVFRKF